MGALQGHLGTLEGPPGVLQKVRGPFGGCRRTLKGKEPPQSNSFQPWWWEKPKPTWAREVLEVRLSLSGTRQVCLELLGNNSVKLSA